MELPQNKLITWKITTKLAPSYTCAAADLPHPDDMLTITPCFLPIISGVKCRNTFATPLMFVSTTASNSSTGTSHILLFLFIVPALFTGKDAQLSFNIYLKCGKKG